MHDDLIAALERAAATAEEHAAIHRARRDYFSYDRCKTDAATIRALITDLRAGNLVRREDVVAGVTRLVSHIQGGDHERGCGARYAQCSCGYEDELYSLAIAAGAHEGDGGE